jgi:EmrB/QacA subfamily drug resistance transporter
MTTHSTEATPPTAALTPKDQVQIVIGVLLVMGLAALDQTIVAPALPEIGTVLGDVQYLTWIISIYFLTATAVTPLYGKLADIKGRRMVLLTAVAIFVIGSIACGLSRTMFWLIIGRAIQGLGGGGLIALAQTVIGDVVPPRERGKYMVYISGVWATASIAGPILGGVLAQHIHWSMIFWINLPLAAIAIGMSWKTLKKLPRVHRPHRLDFLGAGLVVVATIAFLLACTWGGTTFPWGSPVILSLFAATIVIGGVVAWHLKRTEEAIIPLRVLVNPSVSYATLCLFFTSAGYVGISVYAPLYFEMVHGLDASASGAALVAFMIGTVVGANFGGRYMSRVKSYKRLVQVGTSIGIVAVLILALWSARLPFALVEVLIFGFGAGIGVQFPVATISVQNAVEPSDLGAATATLALLRSLGSVFGVAALGAVLLSTGVVQSLGEGVSHAAEHSAAAQANAAAAFSYVFYAAAGFLFLGQLMFGFVVERPLRERANVDAHKDVVVEV